MKSALLDEPDGLRTFAVVCDTGVAGDVALEKNEPKVHAHVVGFDSTSGLALIDLDITHR